jgi:hypothetical protein
MSKDEVTAKGRKMINRVGGQVPCRHLPDLTGRDIRRNLTAIAPNLVAKLSNCLCGERAIKQVNPETDFSECVQCRSVANDSAYTTPSSAILAKTFFDPGGAPAAALGVALKAD